jgi:hypothetical protein
MIMLPCFRSKFSSRPAAPKSRPQPFTDRRSHPARIAPHIITFSKYGR